VDVAAPVVTAVRPTVARFADHLRDHAGLIAPVVLVAFVFLKVFRVARAQPATTISLLSGSDKVAIAMGALLPLLYTAAAGTVIGGWLLLRRAVRAPSGAGVLGGATVCTVGLIGMMLLVPWPVLFVVPVLAVAMKMVWWLFDRVPAPRPPRSPAVRVGAACVVVAVGVATFLWSAVDDRPWVAAEKFRVGGVVIVGYPMSESEWTTILREDSRTIVRVRSDEIAARALCEVDRSTSLRSVAQVFVNDRHPAPYPTCGT
jgi:hypothetical protein